MTTRFIEELVRRGRLTPEQVRRLESLHAERGGTLDTVLLEAAWVDETTVLAALATSSGLSIASPTSVRAPADVAALRAFPEQWARKYMAAPLALDRERNELSVLVTQASEPALLQRLGAMLELRLVPLLTTEIRVHERMSLLYGARVPERFALLLQPSRRPAVSTSLPPMPPPGEAPPPDTGLREAMARLREAQGRDEIIQQALARARTEFEFTAFFKVGETQATGWGALGTGGEGITKVVLPSDARSAFATAIRTQAHFLGPLPMEDLRALAPLRRAPPRAALIIPVRVRDRTVALLYAEQGAHGVSPRAASDLMLFTNAVGLALEGLVKRRKGSTIGPAPEPVARIPRPEPEESGWAREVASALDREPQPWALATGLAGARSPLQAAPVPSAAAEESPSASETPLERPARERLHAEERGPPAAAPPAEPQRAPLDVAEGTEPRPGVERAADAAQDPNADAELGSGPATDAAAVATSTGPASSASGDRAGDEGATGLAAAGVVATGLADASRRAAEQSAAPVKPSAAPAADAPAAPKRSRFDLAIDAALSGLDDAEADAAEGSAPSADPQRETAVGERVTGTIEAQASASSPPGPPAALATPPTSGEGAAVGDFEPQRAPDRRPAVDDLGSQPAPAAGLGRTSAGFEPLPTPAGAEPRPGDRFEPLPPVERGEVVGADVVPSVPGGSAALLPGPGQELLPPVEEFHQPLPSLEPPRAVEPLPPVDIAGFEALLPPLGAPALGEPDPLPFGSALPPLDGLPPLDQLPDADPAFLTSDAGLSAFDEALAAHDGGVSTSGDLRAFDEALAAHGTSGTPAGVAPGATGTVAEADAGAEHQVLDAQALDEALARRHLRLNPEVGDASRAGVAPGDGDPLAAPALDAPSSDEQYDAPSTAAAHPRRGDEAWGRAPTPPPVAAAPSPSLPPEALIRAVPSLLPAPPSDLDGEDVDLGLTPPPPATADVPRLMGRHSLAADLATPPHGVESLSGPAPAPRPSSGWSAPPPPWAVRSSLPPNGEPPAPRSGSEADEDTDRIRQRRLESVIPREDEDTDRIRKRAAEAPLLALADAQAITRPDGARMSVDASALTGEEHRLSLDAREAARLESLPIPPLASEPPHPAPPSVAEALEDLPPSRRRPIPRASTRRPWGPAPDDNRSAWETHVSNVWNEWSQAPGVTPAPGERTTPRAGSRTVSTPTGGSQDLGFARAPGASQDLGFARGPDLGPVPPRTASSASQDLGFARAPDRGRSPSGVMPGPGSEGVAPLVRPRGPSGVPAPLEPSALPETEPPVSGVESPIELRRETWVRTSSRLSRAPDTSHDAEQVLSGDIPVARGEPLPPEHSHVVTVSGRVERKPAPPPSAPEIPLPERTDVVERPSAGPAGPDFEALLDRLEDAAPESRVAAHTELLRDADAALPHVMRRFPGRLTIDPFAATTALPPFAACGALANLVAAIGPAAHTWVSERLDDPLPAVRLMAVHYYGSVPVPDVLPRLTRRLHDEEPQVAALTVSTLTHYREYPGFQQVLAHLHSRLGSPSPNARKHAVRLLGALRDGSAVPLLAAVFDRRDKPMFDAVEAALAEITRQRLGPSAKKWLAWWEAHRRLSRVDWLLEALDVNDPELRRAAADELRVLSGLDVSFQENAPKRIRDDAKRKWGEWWARVR